MSAWRLGVLMALCLLRQARGAGQPAASAAPHSTLPRAWLAGGKAHTGHVQLPAPQNVTLLSKDFDMILTWTPGEGSPPNVTYTVRYESQERMNKWIKVPHCKNIIRTSCNLTCVLSNFFVKVRARVKTLSGQLQSPWVESQFKEYHLDVELAPPVLNVNVKENFIHVNASFPLATCVESFPWMYDLNLWEAGSEDKKQYEGIFRKKAVTIDTTALRGNYCLSARSSFQSIDFKHSRFSHPVCVLLNHKAVQWKFPLSTMIPVVIFSIFLTSPFIICWLKQDVKQMEMPHALDVSHLKAAGPAFHCELSEKEFFRDYLICTEKPVSQRKTNKAVARNNPPGVASLLSPSSSSEEEEEEEDSRTFIPYTEMLHFPKIPNCQPPRTAQGESSLDSGSGGLSVDSGSVLDLSTLGFSYFPMRKNEVDTSDSQGTEKTSLSYSSSLGRLSLSDVRFPGPRELGQHDTDRDECLEMTPVQTLMEEMHATHPGSEHCLHRKAHHFPQYSQKPAADLHVQMDEISQLREHPSTKLVVSLQTLQVAEDEGIASDCDSNDSAEGTLPTSTGLSDAYETSNKEEEYDQKFQFKAPEHTYYVGRI